MSNTTEILVSASMFGKLYSKMIMEVADKYSMNKVEVDILLFLNNNPKYDTAKDIVELRGIAKSYVSKSVDKLVAKLSSAVETLEGKVDSVDKMGRKKLAYEINNFRDGFFVNYVVSLDEAKVADLKRQLRLSDSILRTMFLAVEKTAQEV